MKSISVLRVALTLLVAVATPLGVFAQDFPHDPKDVEAAFSGKNYSPYAGRGFPTQVFWGDTHLHTALSMDAGSFGNRLGMDEAFVGKFLATFQEFPPSQAVGSLSVEKVLQAAADPDLAPVGLVVAREKQ